MDNIMNDNIENTEPQEIFQEKPQFADEIVENKQHISDVIVTQIILCITLVTGVFILNIFKPDVSTYILKSFKQYSSMDFAETIKTILAWIYDRI